MGYTPKKKKDNSREREVQEDLSSQGWKVLYKGWPDFLCYKEENGKIEAFFIEVKRKPYKKFFQKTYDIELSPIQQEMHRVLKKLGFEVKVIQKD